MACYSLIISRRSLVGFVLGSGRVPSMGNMRPIEVLAY
jgi:hypothetical protein